MRRGIYLMMSLLLIILAATIVRYLDSWALIVGGLAGLLGLLFFFLSIKSSKITNLTDFSLQMVIYSYLFLAVALPLIIFLFTRKEADIWGIFLTSIIGLFCIGFVLFISLVVAVVSLFIKPKEKVSPVDDFVSEFKRYDAAKESSKEKLVVKKKAPVKKKSSKTKKK